MALKKELADRITGLLQKNPQGMSITEIVASLRINRNTASRYLENLLVSGQVELRRLGMAKIYRVAQRVPLSAVLSISVELVLQLDKFFRIIFVNDAFCQLAGTDQENLLGKNIEFTPVALVFDDVFVKFIERIREGLAGVEWSGEIHLRSKGIIVLCRIAPTVFDDGRRGVSILLEDITQKKEREWALLESEATARALMNSPADTVILMDTRGRILDLNDTAAQKFRHYGENLVGTMADALLSPEIARSRRAVTTRVLTTQQMVRYEDERDGRWYDTVVYPVVVHGEVTRIAMIARDITDRKQVENALRESEDRYRQLVEISPDAVLIHQEGIITYLNPAATSLLGAKNASELLGKPVIDLIHPDFRDAIRNNIASDMEGKRTPPIDVRMIRQDGATVIVEGRGAKTTIRGRPAIQVAIRDITERKCIETALRESEEKYRTLVERANDVVCVVQDGFIKMCNPRLADYWGGSYDETVGRPFTDFVHPDALPEIFDKYQRRLSGEVFPSLYETSFIHKNGSRSFVEVNAGIIEYEGKPADLVIVRDINERKKTEKDLRESETLYRTLAEASRDLIFVIDRNDRIEYVNSYAATFVNKPADQIIGKPRSTLFPPDVSDNQKKALREVFESGVPFRSESALRFSGHVRWFDHILTPIWDADNTVRAVLGISRDITDRKNADGQLRTSQQLYQKLLEQSFDAVAVHKDNKIVYLNERAVKILGAGTPGELMGKSIFAFIHPDSRKDLEDRIQQMNSEPEKPAPVLREKFFRADGTVTTVDVMAMRFSDNGVPAVRVVFREVVV